MDREGVISDVQKRIYRYMYSYVDDDNFRSILKETKEDLDSDVLKKFNEDKEKATQAMIEHFKCNGNALKNFRISSDDPCFYLNKNLKDNIKFSKLLEDYPVGIEKNVKMYDFFSLFIHPRCELYSNSEEAIMIFRKKFVMEIIDFVFNYLKAAKLITFEEKENNFEGDFFNNKMLEGNVHNIKEFEKAILLLIDGLCRFPDGIDSFTLHFINRVSYIIKDMMISLSLGYKEHVIAIFKSFMEEHSVYYAIASIDNIKEFDYIKRGFWISSRVQLDEYFQQLGMEEEGILKEEMEKLYKEYYKEKYELNSYDDFYNEVKRNSLYFLKNEKKNYNKFVKELLEKVFVDEKERREVMTMYKISNDMAHASGYNFNASEGVVNVTCQKVMIMVFKLMRYFILNASITLSEHGFERNVEPIIKVFNSLIEMHYEALKEVLEGNTK